MTATQPPEGLLIEEARESRRRGLSQNRAAELAGLSGTRWRHIVNGTRPATGAKVTQTVARMALVVDVTPQEMERVGRPDVAQIMAELQDSVPDRTGSGHMKGWPLRPTEELWWEPQDPSLPGGPAIRYTYRWTSPEDPADYIESSKGMDPERDPLEVAALFREMLAKAYGDRILGDPEDARNP
ncbi:hypothetical protein GCM10023224_05720 [Streptomonospora halophila]|uniref:Helix-turn-helix domain-containing protein n=1 Tax=Streptomonospora halophila TaxID=427369 RepID=A0ABP9G585_9ACTN